ncbi:hypothetical protein BH09ACT1_BH09ACT1_28770 [soil metagenome]
MSDINPALPDPGPGDASHEGDSWEINKTSNHSETESSDAESSEQKADNPESATTSDGALSPGSTATDSPTELD